MKPRLLNGYRKLTRPRKFAISTISNRKLNEVKERNKKETWESYVNKLNSIDRQELEVALRRKRRENDDYFDLSPKDVTKVKPISRKQSGIIFINNFIPFFGFGFLDNFIMILCGDYLEMWIGQTFVISTMACAALGNTVSDAIGIFCAGPIEVMAFKMGIPIPNITNAQEITFKARASKTSGQFIGVIIGCLIGMMPLYFKDRTENCEKS